MFPYEKDYFNHLLEKEDRQRRKYPFRAQSPQVVGLVFVLDCSHVHAVWLVGLTCFVFIFYQQISGRGPLIDVIKESAAKLSLGPSTVHLSVYMLDLFMDSHDILPHQLILTAQTCLFVAGIVSTACYYSLLLLLLIDFLCLSQICGCRPEYSEDLQFASAHE